MIKLRQTKGYLDSRKNSIQTNNRFKHLINFIGEGLKGDVLDVAERNPFTETLEKKYIIQIDNTKGDLDRAFSAPKKQYDFIICSHVIEHIFHPMHLLIGLQNYLKSNGKIIIAYPQRPQFLWTDLHFLKLIMRDLKH
jgi:2-polyprenyl-3-methyl-5-hydroxy-6-metoxy-1,4-benzoquinol methylase